jgi:P-type Cu2+ transporter
VSETPGSGLARRTPEGEERLGSARWCGVAETADGTATLWYRPLSGAAVAFRFEDSLRSDARPVVERLRAAGYATELLSGDRLAAVEAAARDAGIAAWRGRLTPPEKLARLHELSRAGRKVVMVGDGLNDAPALAGAHASISPSTAADVSQTAADVIFLGDKLGAVTETLAVARAARRLALNNFAIAIGYNILFVPLAVAGLVTPLIAAVAMSTSSLAVTANALRLKTQRLELRAP